LRGCPALTADGVFTLRGSAVHFPRNTHGHQRDKADELREKIASAWNYKWAAQATVWLAEHEQRIHEIENWIGTLQGWIEENQRDLGEIE